MKLLRTVGAGLSALGIAIAGAPLLATSAQADTLTPRVDYYDSYSTTAIGGGPMFIEGENLYGAVKVTFGGVEAEMLTIVNDDWEDDGTIVPVSIPPHAPGTVPVVVYLDPNFPGLPSGETVVTNSSEYVTTAPATVTSTVTSGSIEETVTSTTDVPVTSTQYETATSTVASTYETTATVDGLIAVPAGDYTYDEPWTEPLSPATGPSEGGTPVIISGAFLDDILWGTCFEGVEYEYTDMADLKTARADISARVLAAVAAEGMDVYFDGVPGTDVHFIYPLQGSPFVSVKAPEHTVGKVDVSAVFPGTLCSEEDGVEGDAERAAAAAIPEYDDNDLILTRQDAFEFVSGAPAPTSTKPTEPTVPAPETGPTSAPQSVTAAPTAAQSTTQAAAEPTAATTTAAVSPVLSATGITSSTGPMAAIGLTLLATGIGVLTFSRRTRRSH